MTIESAVRSTEGKTVFNGITIENAGQALDRFIETIPPYDGQYRGRGIVIPAGGSQYFTCAWVCIRMLRHLGCRLPVQVWHLGEGEMNRTMKDLLGPLDVECVDALNTARPPGLTLGGWELKAYSLFHSSFEEVLLLDADVVSIIDPESVFDWNEFRQTGAIFWPDFNRFGIGHPIWNICGIQYQDEPRVESSQLLVNKAICWKALRLALWFNEHSYFYYRYTYGDKDTFHLAFRKLNQPYSMPYRLERIEATNCHHDFLGNRIFQHRNCDKWNFLSENKQIQGFVYEKECFEFLKELRSVWKGDVPQSHDRKPL